MKSFFNEGARRVLDRFALTKKQRWELADKLAHDRLPAIDANLSPAIPPDSFYVRHGKRALDILIAFPVLLITLPINILIGIVTFFDVGLPLFYKQDRVGRDGAKFVLLKFRNMTNDRDENGDLLPPDQRVTSWGRFVRKTSLDELLNFWSILKGDMSIIGPRPLLPEHTHRFNIRHRSRMTVRPGLECPPRKDFGHVLTRQEQFDNDVWYVENLSFKTDLKQAFRLVKLALNKKSTEARATAARGIFMGYTEDGVAITLEEVPQEYIDLFEFERD